MKQTVKSGRKRLKIDWEEVGNMLMRDISAVSIAHKIGLKCSDTLYNHCKRDLGMDFSAFRQQKQEQGADNLKETAYDMAQAGDKTMLIFLLKNRAGYADRTITDTNLNLSGDVEKRAITILDKVAQAEKDLEGEE